MKVIMLDSTIDMESKIAQAARICYGKEEDTSNVEKLVKRLKNDGHLATLRFANVTFQLSEMSRSCSMQMLRHAFLDVLQRSQRFCKEFQFEYVTPPAIANNKDAKLIFDSAMANDQLSYDKLIKEGIKAEDARYVLSNACYTKMNIIGNLQSWHDFLYSNNGRLQKTAQWEIKEFALEIEQQLSIVAPNLFNSYEN